MSAPSHLKPKRYEREACRAIERLVEERRAGRRIDMEELDPLTWELLVLWESREREHELLYRENLADLVEALKKPRG
ncbi:MAG TPA: hypothetical protein VF611_12290 [Pyrinomonadaceae bacterium]